MTVGNCPVCLGESVEVYRPLGSAIGLVIDVCNKCSLVHSHKDPSTESNTRSSSETAVRGFLSCDADYSETRVGKQQMTLDDLQIFANVIGGLPEQSRILDMAAARGHFVEAMAERFPRAEIVALEPDTYMAQNIRGDMGIDIKIGDFRSVPVDGKFDLVFSCHTLEHYSRPLEHLRFVAGKLSPDGVAIIDVPDFESLSEYTPIDEFFYDKHRVYFTYATLTRSLAMAGLEIAQSSRSNSCLKVLAKHGASGRSPQEDLHRQAVKSIADIGAYARNLERNRAVLPEAVSRLEGEIDLTESAVALGAGRIFDAAVRYGNLRVDAFSALVDNFLVLATDSAYGRRLVRLDEVSIDSQTSICVFARQASGQLAMEISRQGLNCPVYDFSALVAEFADAYTAGE